MDRLAAYHWPGNIRELENVIERQVILTQGNTLRFNDLQTRRGKAAPAAAHGPVLTEAELKAQQRRNLIQALETCRGKSPARMAWPNCSASPQPRWPPDSANTALTPGSSSRPPRRPGSHAVLAGNDRPGSKATIEIMGLLKSQCRPRRYSGLSRKQSAGRRTQRAAVLIRASARRPPSSRRVTRISPEAGKTPVSAVILT